MNLPLLGKCSSALLLSLFLTIQVSAQVPLSGNVSDGAGGPLLTGVVYHATTSLTVPVGQTLTVQAGAILKFPLGTLINIDGQLNVAASAGNPAIFTAITDDSAGGDTPGDGPTSGSPGYWRGAFIVVGGTVTATGLESRFTGQSGYAAIRLSATPGTTLTDCTFRDYSGGGIDYSSTGVAIVSGCSFVNGNVPVQGCSLNALATFTGNTASGNSVHDSVEVIATQATGTFTIPANSVMGGAHKVMASLSIAAGANVTIEGGVVFKLAAAGSAITVDGTLIANGMAGNPVVFTEFRDDSHGGDSNKNGAANAPAKGFWRGFTFGTSSGASVLDHTHIRFSGQSGFSAITLNSADITVASCVIDHGSSSGIDVNLSNPIVTNCGFDDVTIPINDCPLSALPNFSGNNAANCTVYNAIETNSSTIAANVSISGPNLINSVLVCSFSLSVSSGTTLSLDQGVILKFVNIGAAMTIDGELHCDGSSGEVVFTTAEDDSHGGDSNADGLSSGTPGRWRGLTFNSGSGASVLDNVRIRYTGQSGFSGIDLNAADISLTNSVIEDATADGLALSNSSAAPTVVNCSFDRCLVAVDSVLLPSLAGFSGNSATGNSLRDSIRVTGSTIATTLSLAKNNLINDVVEIVGNLTIDPGGDLSLGQGIVVKMTSIATRIVVSGTLTCQGTGAQPIVFTDLRDDQNGGDTNKNGPSTGVVGHWRGLLFNAGSDSSSLDHVQVLYSGQSSFAAVEINGANIALTNSIVSECSAAAVQLNGTAAMPTIENCAFNNATHSIRGLRWGSLAFIRDNSASGNSIFDSPLIESGAVVGAVSVTARSMINGALVVNVAPVITAGNSLTIERGVVVKVQGLLTFSNGGAELNLRGTGAEPVVFTSINDDDYGGDTNKNGPSSGAPGNWRGFQYLAAGSSIVEHVLVRYGGQASFSAFRLGSPLTTMKAVRVEHAAANGFELISCTGPLDNLVAFDCNGAGIELATAAMIGDIRFATVTACGTGILFSPAQTATIQGTISWGNTTNYAGVGPGQLFDSNGEASLAGMDGNIDVDPLFVDASPTVGDLTLQQSSPCIDAADFALGMTIASDHIEGSRILDHDLDGIVGADMGAYEFGNWEMSFAGQPRIGTTMTFTLTGMPALAVISIALLDYEYYYPPYGMVLCGSPLTLLHQDLWFVNYGYPVPIPNDPFAVGYEIGVQMGCAVYGNTGVGNIASLYRGVIQD